jgi:signal transduction histidine kinase
MPETYQIPAIGLIAALMLAFAYLHLRFRSTRTLLWLLAIGCAEVQAILVWLVSEKSQTPLWAARSLIPHPLVWMSTTGEAALVVSSALFLASLSPGSFTIGRVRILYVVPYAVPLLIYSILYSAVSQHPHGWLLMVFCLLGVWVAVAGFLWSIQKGAIPIWLAVFLLLTGAVSTVPAFLHGDVYWPLVVVESGNMLMTVLLVIYSVPDLSPGVFLAVMGFTAWALPPLLLVETQGKALSSLAISLVRCYILGKVSVAMGLILLVLEDQVEKNQAAQVRERRVRLELEAYSRQPLTARSIEEFDRDSGLLCAMIVEHSRFAKAAMVVRRPSGSFQLTGSAGIDGATAAALDSLAQRLPQDCFSPPLPDPDPELAPTLALAPGSPSLDIDLRPWLYPGDDLERVRLTRLGAVLLHGPDTGVEGALLLAGLRSPGDALRADDLLPLEILAGRIQAARAQAMMLGKLIESERFAGVGQLATNVAQQLNNPLTVILGYSALLEESLKSPQDSRSAEAITQEGRRMKAILERLSRFSRLSTERFSAFSVADLIADVEQLHRIDFLRHSIEFRSTVSPDLPSIFGNVHQMRQALMHAMQFAIEHVIPLDPSGVRAVRIEASAEQDRIKILIGHSGHPFPNPERAFDTLTSGFGSTEATGIGLSLSAALVREHHGSIHAVNLTPAGAAVILELPIHQPAP